MREAPSPGEIAPAQQRQLVRGWYLLLLRGVIALAFAVGSIMVARTGLEHVAAVIMAYALCDGAVALAAAALWRAEPGGRLWLFAVDAMVSLGAGLAMIVLPDLTPRIVVIILALRAAFSGVVMLMTSIRLAGHNAQLWMIAVAVASIGFATISYVVPFAVATQLARCFTVYLMVLGMLMVGLGMTLRPSDSPRR